ncbi:EpsG family protein [Bacteroides fragilis]
MGCRGFIGWDWMSYYPFFLSLPVIGDVNYWEKIVGFERGFVVFASLIKSICDNYFALQLVIVAFYLYAVDKLLMRYARIYSLGFLVFLVMGGFATQIDLLRNSISIALFLLSIQYIESRKTKQYMFLNSIGLLFHTSSIVFFPLYYILQRRYDRKLLMVLFLIGNIIFLLQIQYLKPILSFLVSPIGGDVKYLVDLYFADNENANFYGISIGYLERLLTTSLFLIYYDRIIRSAKYNLIFLNLYVLYFISFFLFWRNKNSYIEI